MDVINVKGLDKNKATFALDVTDIVVDYVNSMMDDNVDKRAETLKITDDLLAKNAVVATVSERRLIEIVIDEALKRADK